MQFALNAGAVRNSILVATSDCHAEKHFLVRDCVGDRSVDLWVCGGTAIAIRRILYIGAQGHYSYIKADLDVSGVGSEDDNLDGFGGGGFIGFGGTDLNNVFYGGIEAEVGYDNADRTENIAGTDVEAEAQLTAGISARIGMVWADRFLFYVRAGYQGTNGELSVSGFESEDEWINGFRFGVVVEGFVSDDIALRADYTYTIYEDPTNISGVDLDLNQHLFRVGAAYYF